MNRNSPALVVLATLALSMLNIASSPAAAPAESCRGHAATIVGTNGSDVLVGTSTRDVIVGLSGRDRIVGRRGNDLICAGPGADRLFGQRGRDRIFASFAVLYGGPGDDHLEAVASAKRVGFRGGPGDDVMVNRAGEANFTADPGHNTARSLVAAQIRLQFDQSPAGVHVDLVDGTIKGQGFTALAFAEGTHVDIIASQFADVLRGSDADDVFEYVSGGDIAIGRGGNDAFDPGFQDRRRVVLRGGRGADTFSFYGRDQHVYGGPGDDRLSGTVAPGPSSIHGGRGVNFLSLDLLKPASSKRWHHVRVDLSRGRIDADGKVTPLTGIFSELRVGTFPALRWTINGTGGDDKLIAHGAHSVVEHGRSGNDVLTTDRGNDTIWGGEGTDTAFAGPGDDVCYSVEDPTGCEATMSSP